MILITGASGFIGSRVRTLLLRHDHQVRSLDQRASAGTDSTDTFVGDITDPGACHHAMHDVEVVVHLAGEKRSPDRFWPVNAQGTANLLSAALSGGVQRFVHISSVGVIGADPLAACMVDEDAVCSPQTGYERSKWQAEQHVHQAAAQGLPVTIVRPANLFGDHDPQRGLLRLIRSVRDRRFVYLGGREVICNYVFVEDVAHAIVALVEHPAASGRTYHLSDACRLEEFINALADELNVACPRWRLPDPVTALFRLTLRGARHVSPLRRSPSLMRLIALNNHANFATPRLKNELGFSFPVGWREGLTRVVGGYRDQGDL